MDYQITFMLWLIQCILQWAGEDLIREVCVPVLQDDLSIPNKGRRDIMALRSSRVCVRASYLMKLPPSPSTFLFLHSTPSTSLAKRIPSIVRAGDRAPLYVCVQRRAQTRAPPLPTRQPPHTPSIKNLLQTRPPFSTEEGPSV